jgi:hypothetical protein
VVKSSLSGLGMLGTRSDEEVGAASSGLPQPVETRRFSLDPDARLKRKLSSLIGAPELPEYRYVVSSFLIPPSEVAEVEAKLPLFVPADGESQPRLRLAKPPS